MVGVDSDLFAACVFGAEAPEVQSWRADVRDLETKDLAEFDAVIHLAAVCNDPVEDLNPQTTYDIITWPGALGPAPWPRRRGTPA